jgi:hypothetical protein
VWRVSPGPDGVITTIAGDGVACAPDPVTGSAACGDGFDALKARFNMLRGSAIDDADNYYIPDVTNGRIRRLNLAAQVQLSSDLGDQSLLVAGISFAAPPTDVELSSVTLQAIDDGFAVPVTSAFLAVDAAPDGHGAIARFRRGGFEQLLPARLRVAGRFVNGRTFSADLRDTEAPAITLLGDAAAMAECGGAYNDLGATALDVFDGDLTARIVTTSTVSSAAVGAYTVTYRATDSSHNTATAVRTVNVTDTTPPVFDALSLGVRTVLGSCSGAPVAFALPTATDGCSAPTVSCAPLPGNWFGPNLVACTATDASGHAAVAAVVVNVLPPLTVAFQSPLSGAATNRFNVGQTIPHKVKLFDCSNADVTSQTGVTVQLTVTALAAGSANLVNDVGEYAGMGDAGSLMVLADGQWQFNLKTTSGDYAPSGQLYLSTASATYDAAPALVAGIGTARLQSK